MDQKRIHVATILTLISILTSTFSVCPPRSGTTFKAQGKSATMPEENKNYVLKNITAFEETLKKFMADFPTQTKSFMLRDDSGDHTWDNLKDVRMYLNNQWNTITEDAKKFGVYTDPHYYQAKSRIEALLPTTIEALDKRLAEQNK